MLLLHYAEPDGAEPIRVCPTCGLEASDDGERVRCPRHGVPSPNTCVAQWRRAAIHKGNA